MEDVFSRGDYHLLKGLGAFSIRKSRYYICVFALEFHISDVKCNATYTEVIVSSLPIVRKE